MGSPQQPTGEQITQLKQAAGLQPLASPEWVDVVNGSITIATSMPRESIALLKLTW
jgi:xylan 1,4-beta-xylosidase